MKTTKTIIKNAICILALTATFNGTAQTSIGFKAGTNFGKITFEEESSDYGTKSSYAGINIGIPIEIRINKMFAIQPELNYMTKGSKFSITEEYTDGFEWSNYNSDMTIKIGYIDIPVMFKFGMNRENFGVNFLIGPSFGLMTRQAYDMKYSESTSYGESYSGSESFSYVFGSDDFEAGFDIGANFGLEGSVKLGPGSLFADARYQLSVAHIDGTSFTHKGIQTVIGYRLLLSSFKKSP